MFEIHCGDCIDVMRRELKPSSIDTIITDPPAGIAFMGKKWDNKSRYEPKTAKGKEVFGSFSGLLDDWEVGFLAFIVDYATIALWVAKPGAFNLTWAIPRTSDLTKMGLRLAGWQIRDTVYHVFGSGFPKSYDIGKGMDKAAGAEREVVGHRGGRYATPKQDFRGGKHHSGADTSRVAMFDKITAPATPEAQLWHGWGTALKPAVEEWIVAMKPLDGTFVNNALEWGVAGLNIDECRVESNGERFGGGAAMSSSGNTLGKFGQYKHNGFKESMRGRWPANLILSHPEDEYIMKEDLTKEQKSEIFQWLQENT